MNKALQAIFTKIFLLYGLFSISRCMLMLSALLFFRLGARASVRGPAEHLGRLAPCPPSAVFVLLLSGGFCTQPPPFTNAIRPKCSAGLVVIKGFRSLRGLGVRGASEFKTTRLRGIYSVRKQLQFYEQDDAYCKLYATRRALHAAHHYPHSALCTATHHAHQAVLSGWRR